jgi:hypothetical protein
MADVTIQQLNEKADLIKKKMAAAAAEPDMEKVIVIAKDLEAEAKALERMGEEYKKQEMARAGRVYVQVRLTPDQKKRIHAKTGIVLDLIQIEDEGGAMNQSMPSQRPEVIEAFALREAERRKQAAEADRLVRAELDRCIADLEAVGVAELSEKLHELMKDPSFLGGMLQKK